MEKFVNSGEIWNLAIFMEKRFEKGRNAADALLKFENDKNQAKYAEEKSKKVGSGLTRWFTFIQNLASLGSIFTNSTKSGEVKRVREKFYFDLM